MSLTLVHFFIKIGTFHCSSDPESNVKSVDACMGQSSRDCYLVPWIPIEGHTGRLSYSVEIPSGILAWPKIKIGNHGKLSCYGNNNAVIKLLFLSLLVQLPNGN
jgi:hypothetical protein